MDVIQSASPAPSSLPNETVTTRFCYCIGEHQLLLEPGVTAEILTNQSIYPLPFAPQWCAGLTSLRGDMFPVVDMHRVVLNDTVRHKTQLLFVQHPQFPPIILTCDGMPRLIKLNVLAEESVAADSSLPSWIPRTLQYEGQRLLVADHGRLLRHIYRTSGTTTNTMNKPQSI